MKKIFLLLFIVLATNTYSQNLTWDWVKGFGSNQGETGENMTHDKRGNIYITGYFQGDSLRLGAFKLTKPSFNTQALYVAKLDTAGHVLWAKTATGEATSYAIAVDDNCNVIIGGSFYTSMDFGSSIFLSNGGQSDIYIAKYDTDGNILWAKKAGSTKTDYCMGLGVDKLGNIYSTGTICDGANVYALFGSIMLTNDNSIGDIYIAKHSPNGNEIWAHNYGGQCTAYPRYLTATQEGDFYISGRFFNSHITFDDYTLNCSGNTDAFITKFDSTGKARWANKVGGTAADYGGSLATDNLDNVYMIGDFSSSFVTVNDTTLYNTDSGCAFLCSYNVDGKLNWAKKIGENYGAGARSVFCDAGSNVYFTGIFVSPTIVVGVNTFTNNGVRNVLVAKYNTTGNFLGAISGGGPGNDVPWASTINNNALYIYGNTYGSQSTYGSSTYNSVGNSDLLLTKLNTNLGCSTMGSLLNYSCGADSMISPSGNTVYHNTGVYYDTIPNTINCDSIITVSFIKYSIDTTITAQDLGGYYLLNAEPNGSSYQWLNCSDMSANTGETYSSLYVFNSGNYATVITKHGCTDTTNCTLICFPNYNYISASACNDYTVPSGNHIYTSSGIYQDTIPGLLSCDSIITIYLTITQSSVTALYYASYDAQDSLTLNIYDASDGTISSYLWDFGDGTSSTLQYPQHTYNTAGNYLICLTAYDTSGCPSTYCDSTSHASKTLGINKVNVIDPLTTKLSEFSRQGSLKIFPNPTTGKIIIQTTENKGFIEVVNVFGQTIYNENIKEISTVIDLPEQKGIYFVKYKNDSSLSVIKVLHL